MPERLGSLPVVQERAVVVGQIRNRLPENGAIQGRAGSAQLPGELDQIIRAGTRGRVALGGRRAGWCVDHAGRFEVASRLFVPGEERQRSGPRHGQRVRRELAAVDLGDEGQRPAAVGVPRPGQAFRKNGYTAELADDQVVIVCCPQEAAGSQQADPRVGNRRGKLPARQPNQSRLPSEHGPDALTARARPRTSQPRLARNPASCSKRARGPAGPGGCLRPGRSPRRSGRWLPP